MKRYLIIADGENRGFKKALDAPLMTVGRSTEADFKLEDPKVSRMHLEIRVEAEGVFVKNRSVKGSALNGGKLTAEVSLNPGDVLLVGSTQLRYEEGGDDVVMSKESDFNAVQGGAGSAAEVVGAMDDRTRVAPAHVMKEIGKKLGLDDEDGEGAGKTKVFEEAGTRVASEEELKIDPRKIEKQGQSTGTAFKFMLLLVLAVVAVGGAYGFLRKNEENSVITTVEFKDPAGVFSMAYPSDWVKVSDKTDVSGLVHGVEGAKDWARVNLYRERNPAYELAGLTDGFVQYEDVLRQRFKDFKDFKLMSKVLEVNNITAILFKLEAANLAGKGLYVLHGPTRVVVECFCKPDAYDDQFSSIFSTMLSSFRLRIDEPQLFMEYALPTSAMKQLALADPAGLERAVQEHMDKGKALLAERDVKLDNLYKSIQEYRQAMQLAISGPKRLPVGDEAARALLGATKLFGQVMKDQRFEIQLASKEGDSAKVRWHALKIMQMIPDKADPAYIEAANTLRDYQR